MNSGMNENSLRFFRSKNYGMTSKNYGLKIMG